MVRLGQKINSLFLIYQKWIWKLQLGVSRDNQQSFGQKTHIFTHRRLILMLVIDFRKDVG